MKSGFVKWLSCTCPCTVPHLVLAFQCASFRQFTLDHKFIHLLCKQSKCELTKRGALESEHQMWDGTWTGTTTRQCLSRKHTHALVCRGECPVRARQHPAHSSSMAAADDDGPAVDDDASAAASRRPASLTTTRQNSNDSENPGG